MAWLIGIFGVLGIAAVVLGIVSEWKSTGPFRALTYGGTVGIWAVYDEIRSFGARKGLLGFSKAEFAQMSQNGWPRTTDDPNVSK